MRKIELIYYSKPLNRLVIIDNDTLSTALYDKGTFSLIIKNNLNIKNILKYDEYIKIYNNLKNESEDF